MKLFENDFLLLVPEFYLLLCIILSFFFHLLCTQLYKNFESQGRMSIDSGSWIICLSILLYMNNYIVDYICLNNALYSTNLINIIKIFTVLMVAGIFIFYFKSYFLDVPYLFYELSFLMLVSLFSSLLILSSQDLIILIIFLEIQSFCFYILTSLKPNNKVSAEAGLKYFIIGSLGSGFMLLGISLLYGVIGSFNFQDIYIILWSQQLLYNYPPVVISLCLILVGLLTKMGGAPFHFWLPDAYQGAPRIVTAFFLVLPKLVYFVIIFNLYYQLCLPKTGSIDLPEGVMVFTIIMSFIFGSLGALGQSNFKRFLGYSSIVHVSFILLGLISNYNYGGFSAIFYLIVYINVLLSLLGVFFIIREKEKRIQQIRDLLHLPNSNGPIAVVLAISFFSLIGLPPFSGFFSKASILFSLLSSEFYLLSILMIIFSSISAIYYLMVVKIVYFEFKLKKEQFIFTDWGSKNLLAYIVSYSFLMNIGLVLELDFLWYIINNCL